jgi:hypothetical protein
MAETNGQSRSPAFDWKLWPETQAQVDRWATDVLDGNAFAAGLAARMLSDTSTRFLDWVDHFVVSGGSRIGRELERLGYTREPTFHAVDTTVFGHSGGMFPRVVVGRGESPIAREAAIKVESIAAFSRAFDLGLTPVGYPLGPYRFARIPQANVGASLVVVERRGYRGFEPFDGHLAREGRMKPHAARDALAAREIWKGRRRSIDGESAFDETEDLLDRVIELAGGPDLACHLVFEVEREYWQSRNTAARVQKARQDGLGLGWANHDHHTFRCSRRFFARVIRLFERLGFQLRERFHAGESAGWGAQILEHPTTGIVIFADLDLAPSEAATDFAHTPLEDLARPNTVGLWVGLHGESILGAGMHHLEAQFDFEALREALKTEARIETMAPFSDFPFLRQAFTTGERWTVSKDRADRLLALGWTDADQHARFLREGAIGSHLENLQRRDGYKGFNQQSVSAILNAVDPRRH